MTCPTTKGKSSPAAVEASETQPSGTSHAQPRSATVTSRRSPAETVILVMAFFPRIVWFRGSCTSELACLGRRGRREDRVQDSASRRPLPLPLGQLPGTAAEADAAATLVAEAAEAAEAAAEAAEAAESAESAELAAAAAAEAEAAAAGVSAGHSLHVEKGHGHSPPC